MDPITKMGVPWGLYSIKKIILYCIEIECWEEKFQNNPAAVLTLSAKIAESIFIK